MDVYSGRYLKQKPKFKTKLTRWVSDGANVYEDLKIFEESLVPYTVDYKLESDQWFKVDNISSQCSDLITELKNFDSKKYSENNTIDTKSINFILLIQENKFYLQACTPSVFVKKDTFLKLLGAREIDEINDILYLKPVPDAIYFKDKDQLIFKNAIRLTSIFPELAGLFCVATSDDVKYVMENSHLQVYPSIAESWEKRVFNVEIARLALLIKNATEEKWNYCLEEYYKEYYADPEKSIHLEINDGKIVIKNLYDLRNVVHLLNYDCYTTMDKQKRISNSHRVI